MKVTLCKFQSKINLVIQIKHVFGTYFVSYLRVVALCANKTEKKIALFKFPHQYLKII